MRRGSEAPFKELRRSRLERVTYPTARYRMIMDQILAVLLRLGIALQMEKEPGIKAPDIISLLSSSGKASSNSRMNRMPRWPQSLSSNEAFSDS